jgi:tetratricopeptide (TPR) repeat protein
MAKIGRNDPCPCGSGKKYKRCCQAREEARLTAQPPQLHPGERHLVSQQDGELVCEHCLRLDTLTNRVVTLVDQNRLDEALAGCEQLQREYPDMIEGLECSAMVHEARGDWVLAASYYQRALAFTERPEEHDGFDEELRASLRERLAHAEAHATAV